MKSLILALMFIFATYSQSSEEKNKDEVSCVTYKIGKVLNDSPAKTARGEQLKEHFEEVYKTFAEIEFKLFFSNTKSIFSVVEKLYSTNKDAAQSALMLVGGSKVYYKDIAKKEKIAQTDFANKRFNIERPYDEYNWTITSETKIISGYKCYKATCEVRDYDRRRDKETVSYPEVWFAPELPYQYGPRGLDGLPGLVLEGRFSTGIYFYASKIELAIKDNSVQIERPTKGKFVTLDEYQSIQIEVIENDPR